eukprot:3513288-Amphidinium_carterae.1
MGSGIVELADIISSTLEHTSSRNRILRLVKGRGRELASIVKHLPLHQQKHPATLPAMGSWIVELVHIISSTVEQTSSRNCIIRAVKGRWSELGHIL